MADLTAESGRGRRGDAVPFGGRASEPSSSVGAGERAQLILIAGFALAVTLIALALVMNAAIYTENLATRSESVGASNAHVYQQATADAAREAFHYAHDVNNGTHAELESNVTDAVRTYYNVSSRQEAAYGRIVNVSVATTRGTNVSGGDGTDFDAPSSVNGGDWTVADDVSNVRQFRIHVTSPTDLVEGGNDEFRVVASETAGSGQWVLNISRDPATGQVTVGINDSGTYTACTFTTSDFWVNVSAASVSDSSCSGLDFGEMPATYDLAYHNSTNVAGHYSLVVDTDVDESRSVYSSSDPRTRDRLYSMSVEVVYETSDLRYRTAVRIAPGEEDV